MCIKPTDWLSTSLQIGYLEYIHSKGVITKDIAWNNFAMGVEENSNTLYILDFGLVKMYRDPVTGKHVPHRKGLIDPGAPRFMSQNAHSGIGKPRDLV